jgi:hypothetical protein
MQSLIKNQQTPNINMPLTPEFVAIHIASAILGNI